jgi:fructose-1,6-bisphosphatase I
MEIINLLEKAFIQIADIIHEHNSLSLSNHTLSNNNSGDDVKKLDLYANDILKNLFINCSLIRTIGSEEDELLYNTKFYDAPYMICFDPLDGSSNIDVNITTGTIFCIYKYNENNVINNGHDIIAAGYCLYGGATQYILAYNNKLSFNQYSFTQKKFNCINNDFKIKNNGNIYSINESNKHKWTDKRFLEFINICINENYSTRWVGSLVADAHRTIIKGGFFAYPANIKDTSGKIRLLYEAYPFAYIFKIAGGDSSNGEINILDIPFPKNIHQKTPIILSSNYEINLFNNLISKN